MLLLVALATQIAPPPPPPKLQAVASVRIERPAVASRDAWERLPEHARREMIVRDERGEPVLLRLVEHQ